jgi:serine/threonine protein kinase
MSRAHECNIVHRDLKPENVFLVRNEDDEVAKVLDFGVAKMKSPVIVDDSTQTRTGSLIGTPHYMSPEQVQGNKAVDFRSDIWALGIIAFEIFTGQRPFVGNALGDLVLQICVRDIIRPSQLAPVPVGFDDWFARAAERDLEKRFQSARELAQTLRDVVGGQDRETTLVVSDDLDESREPKHSSASLVVPHDRDNVVGGVAIGSLELARTVRGPNLTPVSSTNPDHAAAAVGRSFWQSGSALLVLTAAILGGVVALGAWYRSSVTGRQSRTSFVPASLSNAAITSTIATKDASAPIASVRVASPSARVSVAAHDKNHGNSRRPASSPAAASPPSVGRKPKTPNATFAPPEIAASVHESRTVAPQAATQWATQSSSSSK